MRNPRRLGFLCLGLGLLSACSSQVAQDRVVFPELRGQWAVVSDLVPVGLRGTLEAALAAGDALAVKAAWSEAKGPAEALVALQVTDGTLGVKGAEIARGLLAQFDRVVGGLR